MELITKEKLTKEEVGFLCILGMILPKKFETISVFLMAIEKFSQFIYSQKLIKNTIVFCRYKPPDCYWKYHCNHLQEIITNATMENTLYFVTGDFKLKCLEFYQRSDIKQVFNNMFEKGVIPLINRPTRETTSNATLIGNIFANCFFDTSLKKGIIKTSISDHFTMLSNEKTENHGIF